MANVGESLLLAHRRLMLLSLRFYVSEMFYQVHKTKFVFGRHHEQIISALERVIKGKTRKLIINIAPRYGKTELAVKMFISYGLALNPRSKFLHLSYSASLAADNSLAIKDILANDYYQYLFDTKFGSKCTMSWWQTSAGGGVYATSTLGQITGFGAGLTDGEEEMLDEYIAVYNPDKFSGAIVIDDPIKPEDALSENARESVNRRFETTIRNRVNNRKTPIVIIMQRLHEHDLCGYLQEVEPDEWEVLSLPCLTTDENGNECALWDYKHSVEELLKLREINSWVFDTQYMQNPKPVEGLLFNEKETRYFEDVEREGGFMFLQCDPADEGTNKTCSAVYLVKDNTAFVLDVLYTVKDSEYTIPLIISQMERYNVRQARVESNSAWSLFRKEIKRQAAEKGLTTEILSVHQRDNKELRIFNQAPSIQKYFVYLKPNLQNDEYKVYMREKHSYIKLVKDQKDDGVDTDTAACEYLKRLGMIPTI